jgi:hypothetical protein
MKEYKVIDELRLYDELDALGFGCTQTDIEVLKEDENGNPLERKHEYNFWDGDDKWAYYTVVDFPCEEGREWEMTVLVPDHIELSSDAIDIE